MPLSDEEFQRFQNELVKIKTENYQLEEQIKKMTAGKLKKKCSIYKLRDIIKTLNKKENQ